MTLRQAQDHPAIAGIPLVLGGNVLGWTADEAASFAILDRFFAAGGRMIDTAQGYSVWAEGHEGGESERVIGKWLDSGQNTGLSGSELRAEVRIATKTNMFGTKGGLSAPKVTSELHRSLEHMRTDYVDLYYAHRDEEEASQHDVMAGFHNLIEMGLIRSVGASNFTAERLASFCTIADEAGLTPFTVLQNEFNLVERSAFDEDLQKLCISRDIKMLPWFGLAAGFLTGKYRTKEDLARLNRGSSIERFFEKGLTVLPTLDAVAAETGANHGAIALAWLLAQPGITAPLASARTPEQLDIQFEALELELNEDQLARLTNAA